MEYEDCKINAIDVKDGFNCSPLHLAGYTLLKYVASDGSGPTSEFWQHSIIHEYGQSIDVTELEACLC